MKHRYDRDEIWYWYQQVDKFNKEGIAQKQFAIKYNLEYKKFMNILHRINWRRFSDPEFYNKYVHYAELFKSSNQSILQFSRKHNIDNVRLGEVRTHLFYLNMIEELKKEREVPSLQFIVVPNNSHGLAPAIEIQEPSGQAELIEAKNDIELNISKGVKVFIAPNVDSLKIIKIIELLKDL